MEDIGGHEAFSLDLMKDLIKVRLRDGLEAWDRVAKPEEFVGFHPALDGGVVRVRVEREEATNEEIDSVCGKVFGAVWASGGSKDMRKGLEPQFHVLAVSGEGVEFEKLTQRIDQSGALELDRPLDQLADHPVAKHKLSTWKKKKKRRAREKNKTTTKEKQRGDGLDFEDEALHGA